MILKVGSNKLDIRLLDSTILVMKFTLLFKEENKNIEVTHTKSGTTIVLFSGELDKAVAAMIIANGAKAAGRDVTIFCTFWGLNALKNSKSTH